MFCADVHAHIHTTELLYKKTTDRLDIQSPTIKGSRQVIEMEGLCSCKLISDPKALILQYSISYTPLSIHK